MAEHLSAQLIEGYRQRALAPAELLAADRHLADCAACRAEWRDALALLSPARLQTNVLAAQIEDAEHIAAAQLRAYVAGRLDAVDRELIESHLELCATCQAQTQTAREPWWRAFVPAWFGNPGGMPLAWRLAGALAVLALLVWSVARWRQTLPRPTEIAGASPTPTASALPAPNVAPTAAPLFALNDGGREITLDARGALAGVDDWPEAARQSSANALSSGRVEMPAKLAELKSQGNVLMGGPTADPAQGWATNSATTLLSPNGEIIAERQPTLRWKPLPDATSYVVTINEPAANFREAAVSPKLTKPQWTVAPALPRGRDYTWQVTATLKGREVTAPAPNAPEAKFHVLTAAQAAELARGRQAYAGQHLPLGLLYARLGLLAEAERELQALAKANPDVPVAQTLWREVRAKRRREMGR